LSGATLAWWTPDGGFAGARDPLSSPALASAGAAQGVCLVGLAGQGEREAARLGIRQALRAALGGLLGVDPASITLPAACGEAPYALVPAGSVSGSSGRSGSDDGSGSASGAPTRHVALAISHDGTLSVAAIGLHAAVGIDVMRIADIPDWEALARDYLGPQAARRLGALAPAQRPQALAQAWSEREARLKCLGLALAEWRPEEPAMLAACTCLPLALPEGYVGCLAMAPAASD
jgi:4'-phosphopantetheinyl transferase